MRVVAPESVFGFIRITHQLDDHMLIAASDVGESTAKKGRREIEQSLHRGEILRDYSGQTQTDSFLDLAVP